MTEGVLVTDRPRAPVDAEAFARARVRFSDAERFAAAALALAIGGPRATTTIACASNDGVRAFAIGPFPSETLAHAAVAAIAEGELSAARAIVIGRDAASDAGVGELAFVLGTATLESRGASPSVLARIAARLDAFHRGLAADPKATLEDLTAISTRERAEVLAWGRGPYALATPGNASDDVRRHAAAAPERLALASGDERLTYAALDARVDATAAVLLARGVGPRSTVGVLVERGVDLVVAMLATWRIGAVYVPLDPSYPRDRLEHVVADAGCAIVLHSNETTPVGGAPAWNVESAPASAPKDAVVAATGLDRNVAYIVYTSGSTGRPKGVEVSHRAARNTIATKVALLRLVPVDVQVAVMSQAFDASIFELTMPLLAGSTLVVAKRHELEDFEALARSLDRAGVTVLGATPPTWRGLLEAGWRPPAQLRAMVGGEALPGDLGRRLAGFCRVFNMYGLTETAITSTVFELDGRPWPAIVPIGRPFPNVVARVVTDTGALARVGEEGELVLGGVGIADRYRGLADLTAERFRRDPAGEVEGPAFMTGDRCEWRDDGELAFFGRRDAQVKIRGMRVELGEIEAVLREAADVRDAAVDVREIQGEASVIAWVVAATSSAVDAAALRAHARARLPVHMLPLAVVEIAAIPLTVNGKVDRARLALPATIAPRAHTDGDALAAAVDGAIAELVGTAIDDLGAFDSVGRARLKLALGRRGYDVSLRELFATERRADLLATLRARGATRSMPAAARPPATSDDVPRPATMNQRFPVLTHLSNPGTGAWNCQVALSLVGADIAVLRRAWRAVCARHDALRLAFQWRGTPTVLQRVTTADAPWEHVTGPRDGAAYGEFLRATQERELRTTFELEAAPLMRFLAIDAPDGTIDVVWTYFSGLIDGWSSAIVVRELARQYDRIAAGLDAFTDPAPRFFDHLDRMGARDWSFARPFLESTLGGYRMLAPLRRDLGGTEEERDVQTLPEDVRALFESMRDKPFRTRGVGGINHLLGAAEVARIETKARALHVTPSTLLQAAWSLTLMREHERPDVLIGMVAANRPDYDDAVGKYTSLLPFRFRVEAAITVDDWLRQTDQTVMAMLAYEGVPSSVWLDIVGAQPWDFPFQSTFTFVNYGLRASTRVRPAVTIENTRQIDAGIPPAFGLVVIPGEESWLCRLEYNKDGGYDDAMIARMLETFVAAATTLADARPDSRAADWLTAPLTARAAGIRIRFV